MDISVRSTLIAGVIAFSATAITVTSAVTPPPDPSATRFSSSAVSHRTVELRAATQRLGQNGVLPTAFSLPTGEAAFTPGAAAITPTIAPSPPLINLANWIDSAYLRVEPWVRYGFEVAGYVVSWIPWVGWIIDDQIMVLYNFGESLVQSGVFNFTDWLRGQGSAVKNIADWIVDFGLALVWLGIDELNAWIPLPPLPWYPPRPPAADLPEGFLGDLVVGASNALARVSHGIWNIWEPIKGGIDGLVGFASDVLDAIAWVPFVPLINFQVNEGWNLISDEIDALIGFAHDMISAGDQFVTDLIHGGGLITATINAARATLDSIGSRIGEAIQAFGDWVGAQIDYFVDLVTPGSAAVATVTGQRAAQSEAVGDVPPVAALTRAAGDGDATSGNDAPDGAAAPDSVGGPEAETGAVGDPEAETGAVGGPEAEPGAEGDPEAETGAVGDPEAEAGAEGDPEAEPGAEGDPEVEAGAEGDPEVEAGAVGDLEADADDESQQTSNETEAGHEPDTGAAATESGTGAVSGEQPAQGGNE